MENEKPKMIEPPVPVVDISEEKPVVDSPKTESAATPELTKEEKEAQFKEAYKALVKLQRVRMGKRSSKGTPGAFGGAHPGIKRKKKFARYVARNTVE